jgi:hypothetical protein
MKVNDCSEGKNMLITAEISEFIKQQQSQVLWFEITLLVVFFVTLQIS